MAVDRPARPTEMPADARRTLEALRLLPGPLPAGVPQLQPTPGNALRSSYRGALLGTAVGDALGRPAETLGRHQVAARFGRLTDYLPWPGWTAGPTGTITDDTQLTLEVARSLCASAGWVDPDDLARRYVAWLPRARGAGYATTTAVHALAHEPWWRAGTRSAGNGGAMRAAPAGLVGLRDLDHLRQTAALATVITHADPMAVVGAVAHAWLVAALACTPPGTLRPDRLVDELVSVLADLHDDGAPERDWRHRPGKTDAPVRLVDRLAEVPAWLDAPPGAALDHFYNGAFVLESLPAALWFFLRSPDDAEQVVIEAAMGGRDADTVASMAGAYAGAYGGESAFPSRWVGGDLEYSDELVGLADQLYEIGVATGATPAVERATPVNAREMETEMSSGMTMKEWAGGGECEEDGMSFCGRCKPMPLPTTVYVTASGSAFHSSAECKALLSGQDFVAKYGASPSVPRRESVKVATRNKYPCLVCFPEARGSV